MVARVPEESPQQAPPDYFWRGAGPVLAVGITATRSGLTRLQCELLVALMSGALEGACGPVGELHHGDCTGGDSDADRVAAALGIPRVIHPPDNPALRAFCAGEVILPVLPYRERNKAIVVATCPLVALPATMSEQRFGGTWGTVRWARAQSRPVLIVLPDGTMVGERTGGRYFGF